MGQQQLSKLGEIKSPPINFMPQVHQFQSLCIQRIKQSPFRSSILYSSSPLIYIQPIQTTLQSLLLPRINTTKLFPKEQIIKITQCIFIGLKQLQDKGLKAYAALDLDKLFYSQSTRTFKMVNPAFVKETNFMLVRNATKFCFLAPQQLLQLALQDIQEEDQSFQSDIFVAAICLLQICTLKQSSLIYCPDTYNILDNQIKERLKDVQTYYTSQMAKFLELCLEYDIENRISLEQALNLIKSVKQVVDEPIKNQSNIKIQPTKKASLSFGPGHLPKKLPSEQI